MEKPQTAKIFMNGRSQAVRLPAKFRFDSDEVFIAREGDKVVLSAKPSSWDDFFATTNPVPADFLKNRDDTPPQKRKFFK